MTTVILTTAAILAMFLLERLVVGRLTRRPGARDWILKTRIFHPNAISIIRLPTGLIAILLWSMEWQVFAILWIAFWMISDLTDGTIARNCDLVTETGKWLDPLSDKALYIPPLVFLASQSLLPVYWVGLIIIIDCVGQASRLFVEKTAANLFGKTKTALITLLMALSAFHLAFIHDVSVAFLQGARFEGFLHWLTVFCAILAFLSFYCKVIPDHWYANTLSTANLGCGLLAILLTFRDRPMQALILIFLGQFFDLFDGRLARKFGSTRHGDILDDIADFVSFGLAAGMLICRELGVSLFTIMATTIFLFAVLFRLIRFTKRKGNVPAGLFEGMPSPAGALLAVTSSLLLANTPMTTLAPVVVLATAMIMVSTVHYRHFAQRMWIETPNLLKVVAGLLLLIMASRSMADKDYVTAFQTTLLTMALLYTVLGCDAIARRIPYLR
jgi:CDP-diacylglycerol--serine O-phosphatidyltransferase